MAISVALLSKLGSMAYATIKGVDVAVKAANLGSKILPENARSATWVKLNVGGTEYLTTRETLTCDNKSLFGRLFTKAASEAAEAQEQRRLRNRLRAVWYGPESEEVLGHRFHDAISLSQVRADRRRIRDTTARLVSELKRVRDGKAAARRQLDGVIGKLEGVAKDLQKAEARVEVGADDASEAAVKEWEKEIAELRKRRAKLRSNVKEIKSSLQEFTVKQSTIQREQETTAAESNALDARMDATLVKKYLNKDDNLKEVFDFVENIRFVSQEKDDLFFIDRDPTHFPIILNFMRHQLQAEADEIQTSALIDILGTGAGPSLTNERYFLESVLAEAKFFQIHGLVDSLESLIADIDTPPASSPDQ